MQTKLLSQRRWFGLKTFTFVLVVTSGCRPRNQYAPPPPPKVTVARPIEREVANTFDVTGTTVASASVELRARVNGYLKQIAFVDGTYVKKGDLLFVIEQEPFQVALDRAAANIRKAEATLRIAEIEIQRTETLVQRKAATRSDLDNQTASRDTAMADLAAARAALEQAKLDFGYTKIYAPIAGRIGRHMLDVGNLVRAEQSVLATIECLDPMHVYFNVSEADLLRFIRIREEDQMKSVQEDPPDLFMGLSNDVGYPFAGKVDFVDVGADPATGTIMRRAIFPNPKQRILPGLFARIRATVGKPRTRQMVHENAVGYDQQGRYVLVVNDKNIVEYRDVRLGPLVDGLQAIESGIRADDWIIVNGLQRARPGAPVDPEKADMKQWAAAQANGINGKPEAKPQSPNKQDTQTKAERPAEKTAQ